MVSDLVTTYISYYFSVLLHAQSITEQKKKSPLLDISESPCICDVLSRIVRVVLVMLAVIHIICVTA